MEEEYEILPHQELEYLRHEVEKLKKNPFGDTTTGETLLDSMNSLTNAINKLNTILESANDEMIRDYQENKASDKLGRMIEQQEKLAQGIIAVGEMVKQLSKTTKKIEHTEMSQKPVEEEIPLQTLPPPLTNNPDLPPINNMDVPPPPR